MADSEDRHLYTFFPPWGATQVWGKPAPPGVDWYREIGDAAQTGDLGTWRRLRLAEPGFELAGAYAAYGMNLLIAAARGGDIEILRETLDAGIDINAVTEGGDTALHFVALYGEYPRMADALIKAGADVNAVDLRGRTPLYWACRTLGPYGGEIAELLISDGADVNASLPDGTTVLMEACSHERYQVAKLLLEQGAVPTRKTIHGWTARRYLTMSGKKSDIENGGAEDQAYEYIIAKLPLDDYDDERFPITDDDIVH